MSVQKQSDSDKLQAMDSESRLLQQLGVHFDQPELLKKALTHRSFANENPAVDQDNERLEYLGDAVIDLLVASLLYTHYPDLDEGQLTRLRASLVRTDQLAAIARQLNLGELVRMGKGERATGGASRNRLLCATLEALAGAIYLDQGYDAVKNALAPLFIELVPPLIDHQRHVDPKSNFQEWSQANHGITPHYTELDTSGPDHNPTFIVGVYLADILWGEGQGANKQIAAQRAAQAALQKINQNNPDTELTA